MVYTQYAIHRQLPGLYIIFANWISASSLEGYTQVNKGTRVKQLVESEETDQIYNETDVGDSVRATPEPFADKLSISQGVESFEIARDEDGNKYYVQLRKNLWKARCRVGKATNSGFVRRPIISSPS